MDYWFIFIVLGIMLGWIAFEKPERVRNAWDSIKNKVKSLRR